MYMDVWMSVYAEQGVGSVHISVEAHELVALGAAAVAAPSSRLVGLQHWCCVCAQWLE